MKATGILRRIDDLGRIVIPKEIRRSMGIREGEALEIFVEKDAIVFKKYHVNDLNEFTTCVDKIAEGMQDSYHFDDYKEFCNLANKMKEIIKKHEENWD